MLVESPAKKIFFSENVLKNRNYQFSHESLGQKNIFGQFLPKFRRIEKQFDALRPFLRLRFTQF